MWFFDRFKEGILGGFVHRVSGINDEKAVAGLATSGTADEFADLFDGDDGSFLAWVGFESERGRKARNFSGFEGF